MGVSVLSDMMWSRLSEFVAETMGLHFPPERRADLQRGITAAAKEFGLADADTCAGWVLNTRLNKAQLQVLATHLTIGETYFFREKKTFDVLSTSILPDLIRERREQGKRLRIWSAACCTGEEAYSLAILLRELIPDFSSWHVTILATDINQRFLKKAADGVYGEWSLRESPEWFKERYFRRTANGHYAILPEIRKRVTFAHMNLIEDVYPALATDTNAMDLIFCRNVLMYFTIPHARKVVQNLHRSLMRDGWLAVSPSDGPQALFSHFVAVNFPGVILHRRSDACTQPGQSWTPMQFGAPAVAPTPEQPFSWMPPAAIAPSVELPSVLREEKTAEPESAATPYAAATLLYEQGHYAEAAETLLNSFTPEDAPDPKAFSLLAHSLANQGRLADALAWCDRWVAADKLDSASHYLRAVVLQELGDIEQSRQSFQRAIYLQPDFVLAHFAMGNLARGTDKNDEAEKHFTNAAHLLRRLGPDDPLPESDGLTAGRLTEIISSIVALETVP